MRINYVQKHSRGHADSECVQYVESDRNGAKFISNKQIYSLIQSQTNQRWTLYISTDVIFLDNALPSYWFCQWYSNNQYYDRRAYDEHKQINSFNPKTTVIYKLTSVDADV